MQDRKDQSDEQQDAPALARLQRPGCSRAENQHDLQER